MSQVLSDKKKFPKKGYFIEKKNRLAYIRSLKNMWTYLKFTGETTQARPMPISLD